MNTDSLMAAATERTGLSDFGDEGFREGVDTLLAALEADTYLGGLGRRVYADMISRALGGWLRSEAAWRANPEYARTTIDRPLFIVGMPRTGTTALHKLLARDPALQSLPYWLAVDPQPRPPRESWDENPSYRDTKAYLERTYELNPNLRLMHDMQADEPDECRLVRQQYIADFAFDIAHLPRYRDWLFALDYSAVYARYRRNLQLIGLGDARRWLLKCPGHLHAFEALLQTFPDACIIQTHRAPEQLIPSSCSIRYSFIHITEPDRPAETVGPDDIDMWSRTLERADEVRGQANLAQFYDVDYRRFVADPLAEVERIYEYFGMPLSSDARAAMTEWHSSRPQGRHGEHRYTAEEFGLTEDEIRERFAAYRIRYGLDQPVAS